MHGRGDGVEKIYDPNGNWVEFFSEDCVSDICNTFIRDQYHQQVPGREIRIESHLAGNYDDIQVPTDTGTVTWRVNWGTVTIDGRPSSVETPFLRRISGESRFPLPREVFVALRNTSGCRVDHAP